MNGIDVGELAGELRRFERDVLLATGETVHLAPARPGDETSIADFYRGLSDSSIYFRFFTIRRSIPQTELDVLTHETPDHCVALLAWIDGHVIGIGELHSTEPDEAEVAFAVSDRFQHRGIATLLLEDLAVIGRHLGLHRLVANTLVANEAMKLVLRTVGLSETHRYADGVVTFTLDLDHLDGLVEAASERARLAAEHAHVVAPDVDDPRHFGPLR